MLTLLTNPYFAVPEALALLGLAYGALHVHKAGNTLATITEENSHATPTDHP